MTFHFPSTTSRPPPALQSLGINPVHIITNSIPPKSQWAALPHWHETHTEHFYVSQGYALVRLRNIYSVIGAEDGPVEVPPFTIHGFSRADVTDNKEAAQKAWDEFAARTGKTEVQFGEWREEDVLVEEWTTPMDRHKEIFFRNLISYYRDYFQPIVTGGDAWTMVVSLPGLMVHTFKLLACLSYLDNYQLLLDNGLGRSREGGITWLSKGLIYGIMGAARMAGKVFGWRVWWEEYTPDELRGVCEAIEKQ